MFQKVGHDFTEPRIFFLIFHQVKKIKFNFLLVFFRFIKIAQLKLFFKKNNNLKEKMIMMNYILLIFQFQNKDEFSFLFKFRINVRLIIPFKISFKSN